MRRQTLLCLALTLLWAVGCGTLAPDQSRAPDSPQRTTVKLGRVVRGSITGALSFSGELRSRGQVTVTPRVSGTVASIIPELGATVGQGDVVAELDKTLLDEQVQRVQAALSAAEAHRAALQTASRPEEVAAAQAMYNAANARLSDTSGATQSPAQALATLSAARDNLAQLEGVNVQTLAAAIQSLDVANQQLDNALASGSLNRDQLNQARDSARVARQQLAAALQPPDPAALQQARDAVAAAERDLILADLAASPTNALEAQAFAELAYQRLVTVMTPASDAEIAAAQAEIDHQAAALEVAKQSLAGATLTAPVGGVVTDRLVDVGSQVGPGVAVLEITPIELSLDFAVPEGQIGNVAPGQEITVSVAAFPQDSFGGIVTVTAPSVDPRDRTIHARASISDPQNKLKSGMFAQVSVTTGARDDALLLPNDAVVGDGDKTGTWLLIDGRAKRQSIKLGVRDTQRVEVVDGLFEGAEVILSPPATLFDGQTVLAQ